MKLFRSIALSRHALSVNKFRTVLAMTGISLGVAGVILISAVAEGAKRNLIQQIEAMGNNLLVINAGRAKTFLGRMQTSEITSLKTIDSDALLDLCSSVRLVAPAQEGRLTVKAGTFSTSTKILGTTPDYEWIRNSPVQTGSWFTQEEERASLRLAVIGNQVKENLFGDGEGVGETIRINNIPFEVVGVLVAKGASTEGSNEDDQIIVPLKTALRRVFNKTYLKNIYVQTVDDKMETAKIEIRSVLRRQHRLGVRNKPDDFDVQDQRTIVRARNEASRSLSPLTLGLATVSLLVGGVGILAVMLLAVKDRVGEIGLRMAVGARPRDILVQFMSEALMLGFAGGFLGVLIGLIGTGLGQRFTKWQMTIPAEMIILSLLFSTIVGVVFGVYPASKASLLDPIKSLRAE